MPSYNKETKKTLNQMSNTIIRGRKKVAKHPKPCSCQKCMSLAFNKASRKLFKKVVMDSFARGDSY